MTIILILAALFLLVLWILLLPSLLLPLHLIINLQLYRTPPLVYHPLQHYQILLFLIITLLSVRVLFILIQTWTRLPSSLALVILLSAALLPCLRPLQFGLLLLNFGPRSTGVKLLLPANTPTLVSSNLSTEFAFTCEGTAVFAGWLGEPWSRCTLSQMAQRGPSTIKDLLTGWRRLLFPKSVKVVGDVFKWWCAVNLFFCAYADCLIRIHLKTLEGNVRSLYLIGAHS